MTQAQKAIKEFETTDLIPKMGQRLDGFGPGTAHIFPDGSIAVHWIDGAFTLAVLVEED